MKNKFKEYHKFTKEELIKLSKESLYVFDTNILLNMYRYSRSTVEDFFTVFSKLKNENRIWIPYQVGIEFYENRINVIAEQKKSYQEILKSITKFKNDISAKYKNHPFLNFEEIFSELNSKAIAEIENKIYEAEKLQPNWLDRDEILERINLIFENSTGEELTEERLKEIKAEGKLRYENKIPPGFKDNNKSDHNKFGDLIIWFEIIEKAKNVKKNIIFVSGDTKDDWWLEKDGSKIMPLPALKKEIYKKAGVDFHIYTPDAFLEFSTIKLEKKDSSITEARKFQEFDELIGTDQQHNYNLQSVSLNLSSPFLSDKFKNMIIEIENNIISVVEELIPYDPIDDSINYTKKINNIDIIKFQLKILKNENFNDIFTIKLFDTILSNLLNILTEMLSNGKLYLDDIHNLYNSISIIEKHRKFILTIT
ncbi:PIN-like domain-containing protein [Leptospira bandrabouensis]|uniref:PIN-like domain-containing protein n=1 Tax=Leptospira bandrabouensis TaxID=2484903 RepID=UPI001EEC2144|nr:PIN domain-containing protein [Leptospira bandrabouensis]MCG6154023.1 PIN domain-containing protein [Leptospira bandrabouensis]